MSYKVGSRRAADITSGTLANARISSGSVTQHETELEAALELNELHVDGNTDLGAHNLTTTGTITATDLTGELQTASQPNVTSLGTLSSLVISGDLTVNGSTTTTNVEELLVDQPQIEMGLVNGAAPSSETALDLGMVGHYHNGSAAKKAFMGFDESTSKFTMIPDATETSNVFSGTAGTLVADLEGDVTGAVTGDVTGNVTGNVTGDVTGTVSSLSNHDTDDVTEGASNLYHTTARARASVSGSDAGGDGSFSYNNSTGVMTYTGPSATETRAHFSAGNGLDVASGAFSIDAKANGGLVIEATELAVDLGASSITGTLAVGDGGSGSTTASGARTNLGVAIGSDVQAWDADLDTIAALAFSSNANKLVGTNDSGAIALVSDIQDAAFLGSVSYEYSDKTANYTMAVGTDYAVGINSTGSDLTMTLPTPGGGNEGLVFQIKDVSEAATNARSHSIDAGTGNTIDGAQTFTIDDDYQSVTLMYRGTSGSEHQWMII